MNTSKKSRKIKIALLIAAGVVTVLAIVYLAIGFYFRGHFWFRTTINGVDCSGMTVEEVEQIITAEIDEYQLEISERGGETETIEGPEIGLKPVFDGSLQESLEARSGFAWIVSLFRNTSIELETMVAYDEESFRETLAGLACFQPVNVVNPQDAYLSEYRPDTGYEIVPEVEGTLLNETLVEKLVGEAVTNLQQSVSLEDGGCYEEPKVRQEDSGLVALKDEMNTYVSAEITYQFGDSTEVVDDTLIQQWLSVSQDQQVVIDEEQAAEYIDGLAEKYDTYGKTRKFATSYGATVTLSRNEYGWRLDREEETAKLLADIREGNTVTREPAYAKTARSHGSEDYGGTYVEINLTAQHLYFYKNGSLVVETDFVSGDISEGNGTRIGAFSLYYKERDAVLKGRTYRTPVDFWMPFDGGIGLHDATWRDDFGGNNYKNDGSHGCINLPYSAAKKIFENIQAGDAVFVYELAGTESEKAKAQDAAAQVTDAIKAIGTVTLDSKSAIEAARAAYDGLSDMGKGYVKNYDTLVAAEAAYANLVAQEAAAQAKSQAQPVIDAINAIGEVTLEKKAAIEAARKQYNGLSEAAKGYVTNLNVLTAAEARLQELSAAQ